MTQAAQRAQANGEDYQTSPRQNGDFWWLDRVNLKIDNTDIEDGKMVMVMGCCWKYQQPHLDSNLSLISKKKCNFVVWHMIWHMVSLHFITHSSGT